MSIYIHRVLHWAKHFCVQKDMIFDASSRKMSAMVHCRLHFVGFGKGFFHGAKEGLGLGMGMGFDLDLGRNGRQKKNKTLP